jgi:hypothetical protein
VTLDSWDDAEAWFAKFAEDEDMRGRMSAINLGLLRGARARWSEALECYFVMGLGMVFSPRGAPYSQWVRVEPRMPDTGRPTVAVSVLTSRPCEPGRPTGGSILGGDVCFVPTAPVVLESFLLQIGEPTSGPSPSAKSASPQDHTVT